MNPRVDLLRVVNDWVETLPITDDELDMLECHMGDVIAELALDD